MKARAIVAGATIMCGTMAIVVLSLGACRSDSAGPATRSPGGLAFTVQPGGILAHGTMAPVEVKARDSLGNILISSSADITLHITPGSGAPGAVLGGTLTRAAVHGAAIFDDLTIDRAGRGFTLTADAPGLESGVSASFDVHAFDGVPNGISLQSDPGDPVGLGGTYSYNQANATLTVTADEGFLLLGIVGDEQWTAQFLTPGFRPLLEAGAYGDVQHFRTDTTKGALNWFGPGPECSSLTESSFTIDSVAYNNAQLTAIHLHFDQRCEGATGALHGVVHWDAQDTTAPPGPVSPAPPDLWRPSLDSIPPTGNYVYLESEPGDAIGEGQSVLYTPPDAPISVVADSNQAIVSVAGEGGQFLGMNSIPTLQRGYYPDLHRVGEHNPTKGGVIWSTSERTCTTVAGWFVVDHVTYQSGALIALELRFEQHCDGATAALHGAIRWVR
ncbi:MAG TPA: hypothetical protein VFK13_07570 [Gemmatimonadaceae bacterium]|nr:hypothetical protein [Gemmatimonadaceae bacterium]